MAQGKSREKVKAAKRQAKASRMQGGGQSRYAAKRGLCRPNAQTICTRHAMHMTGTLSSSGHKISDCGVCVGQPAGRAHRPLVEMEQAIAGLAG